MQGYFRWVVELKRETSGYARKIIYNFNKYDFFVGESFTLPGKWVIYSRSVKLGKSLHNVDMMI